MGWAYGEIGVEVGGLGWYPLCWFFTPEYTGSFQNIFMSPPGTLAVVHHCPVHMGFGLGWCPHPPPSVLSEASTLVSPASYGELNSRRREETPEGSHLQVPMPGLFPSVLHLPDSSIQPWGP